MSTDIDSIIRDFALKNAVQHNGTADAKAVISKLLGARQDLRSRAKEVIPGVMKIVAEVNALSPEAQRAEVEASDPSFFESAEKQKKDLPPLPGAEEGKVVTRMPPEPNGYPHIGHGMSFYFNYYYAKRYGGRVILRFDDTNPKAEQKEYYDAIKADLTWMGLAWDREHNMSDDMELYHTYARQLIGDGNAYLCDCPQEEVSKLRFDGKACACRDRSIAENEELWERMQTAPEGSMVLRLKGDVSSQNTAMRDPTIMRIIDHPHPLLGSAYRIWPVYDFACAIEDAVLGITHVLRSNEFALRIELQDYIRGLLGLRNPVTMQYSRFSIRGSPTAKRLIKPLISEGVVEGWDDPRLVTLRGLARRGIRPEAVYELTKEIGLSTSEPEIDWSLIESLNRKIIDPVTKRYFFVPDPAAVTVEGAEGLVATLRMHPTNDMGTRTLAATRTLYIAGSDAAELSEGAVVRLKDLCNIRIDGMGSPIRASIHSGDIDMHQVKKIQWVPESGVPTRVIVPSSLYDENKELVHDSMREDEGLSEPDVATLPVDEVVQFERYGFVRIDAQEGTTTGIYAHK